MTKNCYFLPLIDEFLDQLGYVKRFIQLNLISTYYKIIIWENDELKTPFHIKYGHFEY